MKNKSVTMAVPSEYDRSKLIVPRKSNMVFRISLVPIKDKPKTSVEIEMPAGSSSETVGGTSSYSQSSQGTVKSHTTVDSGVKYRGTDAWWSVGDFLQPGSSSEPTNLKKTNDDDTWDLSDSIVDLYKESNKYDGVHNYSPITRQSKIDVDEWISQDSNNGFVRVYRTETDTNPRMFPCTLSTTAQKLCSQCSMPPNSLHVQFNGDIIRRLDPFDTPLALQNEYLQSIGYTNQHKIQEIGAKEDLAYLVKFYAGKPVSDSTYSRNQLTAFAYVRKGKLLHQWGRRLCVISGTRLLIYRDKTKSGKPTVVQLAKGSVEEVQNIKGHDHVLKVTSTLQGERSVYLSFNEEKDYTKWLRKARKATAKLPTKADLSNCHLEFLPETVFINDGLEILNLRHNVLKPRPIEEDIYTIGWLEDLPRFQNLRSLNLADNNLRCFPVAVCKMRTLTELNLASNKIEDIPPDIMELENLQMLHLHNNELTSLPEEMSSMRHLLVLVLAFNHFTGVPHVLLKNPESQLRIDSLIMAGNHIEKLPQNVLGKMQHIKKIDFRMNMLCLLPSEMAKFYLLELVTHLDVRDNMITDLDVRALRNLEYLNCERNKVQSLQVSGGSIKTLLAMNNEISTFAVTPKPEWLAVLDISYNKLESLPVWLSDCFFMTQLNASHNLIKELPAKLLFEAQKLRSIKLSHNQLTELPPKVGNSTLEELGLEHNQLTSLPHNLFIGLTKLRYICLTNNKLVTIPEPNSNVYQNKLQELYLSANHLGDEVIPQVCNFHKLKVLHLAYNRITEIHDKDLRKLENLQELNVSGNFLRHLPRCVGRHSKLLVLRSNANMLRELPDFRLSQNLKVLEVGSNRLIDVSVTNLMSSNVNLLDISGNPEMQVNTTELKGIKTKKKVCMVDIKGQNRSLLDLRTAGFDELEIPWQSGISQTSGMRNKLSVSVVNRPRFNEGREGLFAIFDGGRNDEATRILADRLPSIVTEEINQSSSQEYLRYTILSAHRKLQFTGQKMGAAGAICHVRRDNQDSSRYVLNVANVGDTEVVLCRAGRAVTLSTLFTVSHNKDEMQRVWKSGGIITEDNRINGVTQSTRMIGSSYLYPHVIPEPHVSTTMLQNDDQFIIIANQGLWKYISHQEAVNEILNIPDCVLAAKKLQDLSQGYHSQENIAVMVIRLLVSPHECTRMRELLQQQFENEQRLLAELKMRDIEREEMKKRMELEEMNENVPMDIVKLKGARKRGQVEKVFAEEPVKNGKDGVDYANGVSTGLSQQGTSDSLQDVDVTANWEVLLQRRLAEEVKDKELINALKVESYNSHVHNSDGNWSTTMTSKVKGQMKERVVTLPPPMGQGQNGHSDPPDLPPHPPPPPHLHRKQIITDPVVGSTESLEFRRELKHPLNVDRDAILFHNMQLTRQKAQNLSSHSIDSTQSDPAYASAREVYGGRKSSSHSIEVLLHGPVAQHDRVEDFGGSYKVPPSVYQNTRDDETSVDSCPTDMPMTDRLRMLENKGFLPNSGSLEAQRGSSGLVGMDRGQVSESTRTLTGEEFGEMGEEYGELGENAWSSTDTVTGMVQGEEVDHVDSVELDDNKDKDGKCRNGDSITDDDSHDRNSENRNNDNEELEDREEESMQQTVQVEFLKSELSESEVERLNTLAFPEHSDSDPDLPINHSMERIAVETNEGRVKEHGGYVNNQVDFFSAHVHGMDEKKETRPYSKKGGPVNNKQQFAEHQRYMKKENTKIANIKHKEAFVKDEVRLENGLDDADVFESSFRGKKSSEMNDHMPEKSVESNVKSPEKSPSVTKDVEQDVSNVDPSEKNVTVVHSREKSISKPDQKGVSKVEPHEKNVMISEPRGGFSIESLNKEEDPAGEYAVLRQTPHESVQVYENMRPFVMSGETDPHPHASSHASSSVATSHDLRDNRTVKKAPANHRIDKNQRLEQSANLNSRPSPSDNQSGFRTHLEDGGNYSTFKNHVEVNQNYKDKKPKQVPVTIKTNQTVRQPVQMDVKGNPVQSIQSSHPYSGVSERNRTGYNGGGGDGGRLGNSGGDSSKVSGGSGVVGLRHAGGITDHSVARPVSHKKHPPPIPPRKPNIPECKSNIPEYKTDINSNSIRSLEELLAYNRQQQEKFSFKLSPREAPRPPPPPPPPTIPEAPSMVSKTASQRSILITYL